MNVTRVTEAEFASMREAWNDLLERSGGKGPMLTWEWAFTWWEAFCHRDGGRDLYLLAAHLPDGRLGALAPLVKRTVRCHGCRVVTLEFIGTGEAEQDETCSEYLDWIIDPALAPAQMDALAQEILGDEGWDEIVLRDVRADRPAALDRFVASARAAGVDVARFAEARCPFIELPATWEAYLETLSRNARRLVRYKRKQLHAAGRVEFRMTDAAPEVMRALDEFMALHQARWSSQQKAGCFASEAFGAFFRSVTERLSLRRDVRIATLTADGEPVALYHLLRRGACLYYYNSGMQEGKWAEYSPGSVCMGYIIETSICEGLREFHFFKAGAGSYKYHWTDKAVPVVSLRLSRRGGKRILLHCADAALAFARAVRARLQRKARRAGEGE